MLSKSPSPNWGTAPFCCVTGRPDDPDGFYNTQMTLTGNDPVAFVSSAGARMLAKQEGWSSPEDMNRLVDRIEELEGELQHAIGLIRELRLVKEGIEGLAANGFELSKKTGRPPRSTEKATIEAELSEAVKEQVEA